MTPREYVLPNAAARPLSVAVGADSMIWYADDRGYLGQLDPATHTVREWAWPGGPAFPPSGIALLRGAVRSAQCNNAGACRLVRFDAETSTFQSWAMPDAIATVTRLVAIDDAHLAVLAGGSSQVVKASIK